MELKSKFNFGDEPYVFIGDSVTKMKIGGVKFSKDGLVIYIEDTEDKRPMMVLEQFVDMDFNTVKERAKAYYKGEADRTCEQIDSWKKEDLEKDKDVEIDNPEVTA